MEPARSGVRRAELDDAVDAGDLINLQQLLRPAEDLALFRAEMAAWPGVGVLKDWEQGLADWVEANDDCRRDILDKLYDEGPLTTRELPDVTLIPWKSSGWNDDRNVRMLLSMMVQRGEVASAGRDGRERLWDLAERVYPDVEPVPPRGRAPDPRRAAAAVTRDRAGAVRPDARRAEPRRPGR